MRVVVVPAFPVPPIPIPVPFEGCVLLGGGSEVYTGHPPALRRCLGPCHEHGQVLYLTYSLLQGRCCFPGLLAPFPCKYLGIPLTLLKPRRADEQPLIDKVAARIPT